MVLTPSVVWQNFPKTLADLARPEVHLLHMIYIYIYTCVYIYRHTVYDLIGLSKRPPWALMGRALMGLCYKTITLVGKISR